MRGRGSRGEVPKDDMLPVKLIEHLVPAGK